MSAKITLYGFDELVRGMERAPQVVRTEGQQIIKEITETTAAALRGRYPIGPGSKKYGPGGNLQRGVRTFYPAPLVGVVRNQSPHAHLWHWGTKDRRTKRGWRRGVMPAANPDPLVPLAQRGRVLMVQRLTALLEGMGFSIGRAA